MFGYVIADKPNMRIKDYTEYKAYYCGLCKSIGKRTHSQLMRFGINYDITFLALIAHNYHKIKPEVVEERCIAHPIGKKFLVVKDNQIMQTIADINTILGYYKVEDDVLDDNKLKHKTAKNILKPYFASAKKRLPKLAGDVKKYYSELSKLEKEGKSGIDALADCFAKMLVAVGRTACGPNSDALLDDLCYNLGRWIYIIDAFDDIQDDFEKAKFNPFLSKKPSTLNDDFWTEANDRASFSLNMAIEEIKSDYDKMDITVSEGPLSNIIYCGLSERTKTILDRRGKKCKKTLF